MIASEPLPHFVDDLLDFLRETHPTHATLDGVHTYDDLLEDLSAQAVEAETRALAGYARRLDEIDPGRSAADHRAAGAERDPGGVPDARRPVERLRSARGVGADEAGAPEAGR